MNDIRMFDVRSMKTMLRTLAVAVSLVAGLMASPAWAGVPEAIKDYEGGNYEKALEQFFATFKDIEAQYYLGKMYQNGQGVEENYSRAWSWYKRAAGKNHSDSSFELARMYEKGQGVPQDWNEAGNWYLKAAKSGNVRAQARLGQMLIEGVGMARDIYEGTEWLQKAAEGGHAGARGRLDEMYRRGMLSKNQVIYGVKSKKEPVELSDAGNLIRNDMQGIFQVALKMAGQGSTGKSSIEIGGDTITFEQENSLVIVMPFVKLNHANGDVTDMGTIRVKVTPEKENTFYRIQMAFSGQIVTSTSGGVQTGILTFEELQVSGLWSKDLRDFVEVDIKTGNLRSSVTGNQIIEVGELVVNTKLVEKQPGLWSGPTLVRVVDFTMTEKSVGVHVTIGNFTVRGETEGMRIAAYKQFQKGLGIDLETGEWNSEILANGFTMPDMFPLFGRASWGEVTFENIEVIQDKETLFKLGRFSMALAASGLEEELGQLAFKGGYENLEFNSKDATDRLVPRTLTFDTTVERFPAQKILASAFGVGVRAAAEATTMAAMGEAPSAAQMILMSLNLGEDIKQALMESGTELVLNNLRITSEALDVNVGGHLKADPYAVLNVFGAFSVEVRGVDELLKSPEVSPAVAKNADALNILRKMGETGTGSDGTPVIRYRIDVTREGPILLNGEDSAKIRNSFQAY